MSKEILYTSALNTEGDLIHIDAAEKGNQYYCPDCEGEFILRKSENTGKGSKKPHFAHNELTSNCTAEGVLHYSFKTELCSILEKRISENKGLKIDWYCPHCSVQHEGNLLAKAISVREEHNLKECQPDIALLDADGNVIVAIEVVVTHSPEDKVLQFYRDNSIILIQINLSSAEDLKNVQNLISTPSIVDYCHSPNCLNRENYSVDRRPFSYTAKCGKCFSQIERYAIEVNSVFGSWHSLDFTEGEIEFIKSKRNNIKVNTDASTNRKYPVSDCMSCKRLRARHGGGRRF